MENHIVILGGGFGGLEVAAGLRSQLDESYRITLIDRKDYFTVGFAKFDLMFGRRSPGETRTHYGDLRKKGIEFVHDTVEQIDPEHRRVKTTTASYAYTYLVVGLGAELHPESLPGFVEGGYSFYSVEEAQRLRPVLEDFSAGTILISIFNIPYQCPPAPFEAALQLHDYFVQKGHRSKITIKIASLHAVPVPLTSQGSTFLLRRLDQHHIEFLPRHRVTALNTQLKVAEVDGKDPIPYDLFMGVPEHRPPRVVLDSPLGDHGWIRVDRKNLRTAFDQVYALGDVTHIPAGNFAVPKTGAFAEEAGKIVVQDILNRIKPTNREANYRAMGSCYLEMGSGKVARMDADILGGEEPRARIIGPSDAFRADKIHFETSRIDKWFG